MSHITTAPDIPRREWLKRMGAAGVTSCLTLPALAQTKRDSVTLNISLEPDGLDPTLFPAASCGQVVHYNIFEGLVKITESGSVQPLLARRWEIDPNQRIYTFELQPGVRFHDGQGAKVNL